MPNRILVIDDEHSVRMLLSYALNDPNMEVTFAATGQEGLVQLETKPFDAVFIDLNLPDLSGEQLVYRVREVSKDTAVVMMTAEAEHLVPARRNVDAYLAKPFRLTALKAALEQAMANRRRAAS